MMVLSPRRNFHTNLPPSGARAKVSLGTTPTSAGTGNGQAQGFDVAKLLVSPRAKSHHGRVSPRKKQSLGTSTSNNSSTFENGDESFSNSNEHQADEYLESDLSTKIKKSKTQFLRSSLAFGKRFANFRRLGGTEIERNPAMDPEALQVSFESPNINSPTKVRKSQDDNHRSQSKLESLSGGGGTIVSPSNGANNGGTIVSPNGSDGVVSPGGALNALKSSKNVAIADSPTELKKKISSVTSSGEIPRKVAQALLNTETGQFSEPKTLLQAKSDSFLRRESILDENVPFVIEENSSPSIGFDDKSLSARRKTEEGPPAPPTKSLLFKPLDPSLIQRNLTFMGKCDDDEEEEEEPRPKLFNSRTFVAPRSATMHEPRRKRPPNLDLANKQDQARLEIDASNNILSPQGDNVPKRSGSLRSSKEWLSDHNLSLKKSLHGKADKSHDPLDDPSRSFRNLRGKLKSKVFESSNQQDADSEQQQTHTSASATLSPQNAQLQPRRISRVTSSIQMKFSSPKDSHNEEESFSGPRKMTKIPSVKRLSINTAAQKELHEEEEYSNGQRKINKTASLKRLNMNPATSSKVAKSNSGASNSKFARNRTFMILSPRGTMDSSEKRPDTRKSNLVVKMPNLTLTPCKYASGEWIVSTPHNGIRMELRDIERVLQSMSSRSLKLLDWELRNFFEWWTVFADLISGFFELEETFLFHWFVENNLTSKFGKADIDKSMRKEKKHRILNLINSTKAFVDSVDVMADIDLLEIIIFNVNDISKFMMSYFTTKEIVLSDTINKEMRCSEIKKFEKRIAKMILSSENCSLLIALYSRALSANQLKVWSSNCISENHQAQFEELKSEFQAHVKLFERNIYPASDSYVYDSPFFS